jgi:hypothetical protein
MNSIVMCSLGKYCLVLTYYQGLCPTYLQERNILGTYDRYELSLIILTYDMRADTEIVFFFFIVFLGRPG